MLSVAVIAPGRGVSCQQGLFVVELGGEMNMPNVQPGVATTADDAGGGLVQAAILSGHGDPVEGSGGHLDLEGQVRLNPTGLQKYGPDFGVKSTLL